MILDLNARFRATGTRFRVYPQAPVLASVTEPETIWVSRPAGSIASGPCDDILEVRDALDKRLPYGADDGPPWAGTLCAPASPDESGHFDHLLPGTRQFEAAHMYAVIRRVLDVWEGYFGRPLRWHFAPVLDRMELIPHVDWDNAQAGFGFIESGYASDGESGRQPYCLNFDVLAHEAGHGILYSEVGVPSAAAATGEYFGFHEAAADITALIAALHFDSVVDRLLEQTRGNLYALNELNRIAELSESDQIRVASNDSRMSDHAAGWSKEHSLSLPLTGALFDVLVEVFHTRLLERRLIDERLALAAYESVLPGTDAERLQARFDRVHAGREAAFREALLHARDYLGSMLAIVWRNLSADGLTFVDVGDTLLDADTAHHGGRHWRTIFECFRWREIGSVSPGPRMTEAVTGEHACR